MNNDSDNVQVSVGQRMDLVSPPDDRGSGSWQLQYSDSDPKKLEMVVQIEVPRIPLPTSNPAPEPEMFCPTSHFRFLAQLDRTAVATLTAWLASHPLNDD